MYLIYATAIILIIILFGNTIFTMIKTYTLHPNASFQYGSPWFIGLLLINIFVLIFIYAFYYYKLNTVGNIGSTGDRGFSGQSGDSCVFPTSIQYQY